MSINIILFGINRTFMFDQEWSFQWRRFGVIISEFEHNLDIAVMFSLLSWNK